MEEDVTQQIQQRLAELPPDVRAAIQSAELSTKLQAIGTKHKLHIDQVGELEDEIYLAMLGFSPLENLGSRLAKALNLPAEEGTQLAAEVSTEVFSPIRESLKRFTEERAAPKAPAEPPAQSQAPAPAPTQPAVVAKEPPSLNPELHAADVMLSEKTLSTPPEAPQTPTRPTAAKPPVKPGPYSADPYREPV